MSADEKLKKSLLSNYGAIAASLLATSCCIGPAVFVIFGTSVGFLGRLAFLDPLRPWLLGLAFLMLGYSFWKLYLKPPPCDCAEDRRSRRMARAIFWAGFSALVFAASFRKVFLMIYG